MQIRKLLLKLRERFKMMASENREDSDTWGQSENDCGTRARREGTKCSRDDSRMIQYRLRRFGMYPTTTNPYILSNYRAITLQPWP